MWVKVEDAPGPTPLRLRVLSAEYVLRDSLGTATGEVERHVEIRSYLAKHPAPPNRAVQPGCVGKLVATARAKPGEGYS